MSITPVRPGTKPSVDEETERVIMERNATFDEDKKTAVPWPEAKAHILKQLNQH